MVLRLVHVCFRPCSAGRVRPLGPRPRPPRPCGQPRARRGRQRAVRRAAPRTALADGDVIWSRVPVYRRSAWGEGLRPAPTPSRQEPQVRPMAGGYQVGVSVGTEHAPGRPSSSAWRDAVVGNGRPLSWALSAHAVAWSVATFHRECESMGRIIMHVVVIASLCLMASVLAVQAQPPDATLKVHIVSIAVGASYSWGGGIVTFRGKEYPCRIDGLFVGGTGISSADAIG